MRSYISVGDRTVIANVMNKLLHKFDSAINLLQRMKVPKSIPLSEQHRASSEGSLGKSHGKSTPRKIFEVPTPPPPQLTSPLVHGLGVSAGRSVPFSMLKKRNNPLKREFGVSDGSLSQHWCWVDADSFVIKFLKLNAHAFACEFTLRVEQAHVFHFRLKKDQPVHMHNQKENTSIPLFWENGGDQAIWKLWFPNPHKGFI